MELCYIECLITKPNSEEAQMLIETLVPMVVSAVVPYLAKGADKLLNKAVDEAVEEGFEHRGKIWETVKGLFIEDELTLLNLFEQNPEDAKTQGKLEGKLEDRLKSNPAVAAQLEELLKQIPASQTKQNTQTITGDGNIAVQDTNNSNIHINK